MTKRAPIKLKPRRLPKSLLRDGWWLVEPREAQIIPFPLRNQAPRMCGPAQSHKEKTS
jgi:hypothetical protein